MAKKKKKNHELYGDLELSLVWDLLGKAQEQTYYGGPWAKCGQYHINVKNSL